MPLSMLRTRPRLQTNALQGTAGQGQGSGAQKAIALRRMRRRRACSRRHLASGAPDKYGDVTRAARGSDGKLRAFFLDACQSSRRPWHLLEARHHVLRDRFVDEALFRLPSAKRTRYGRAMLLSWLVTHLPGWHLTSCEPCPGQRKGTHMPSETQWHSSSLWLMIVVTYACIDSTLFAPFPA